MQQREMHVDSEPDFIYQRKHWCVVRIPADDRLGSIITTLDCGRLPNRAGDGAAIEVYPPGVATGCATADCCALRHEIV